MMRKVNTLLKRVSAVAIGAFMALSLTSCGIPSGNNNDLNSALSSALAGLSSAVSGLNSGLSGDEPAGPARSDDGKSLPLDIANVSDYILNDDNNVVTHGYFSHLAFYDFAFSDTGASVWKEIDGYDALKKAIEERNKKHEDNFYAELNRLGNSAKAHPEMMLKDDSGFYIPYLCKDDCYALRADKTIVSLVNVFVEDIGGPAEDISYSSEAYDTQTGKQLYLEDIVKDKDAFIDALYKKLYHYYPDIEEELLVLKKDVPTILQNYAFSKECAFAVSDFGVIVYIGVDMLTPYSYGDESICVPFSEFPGLFNEKYVSDKDDYFTMQIPYAGFYEEGDDVKMLRIFTTKGPDGADDSLSIIAAKDYPGLNQTGNAFETEIYSWSTDYYLLHRGDQNYLFADFSMENDYRMAEAFEIVSERAKARDVEDTFAASFDDSFPVDTDGFVMRKSNDLMRTTNVVARCSLSDTGRLENEKPYFYYNSTFYSDMTPETDDDNELYPKSYLTSKIEVTVKKIDSIDAPQGSGSDITLPAGTKLHLITTDTKSYADAALDDGTIVRIIPNADPSFDFETSTRTFWGNTPLEDVFDGVFWAG